MSVDRLLHYVDRT